MSTMQPHKIIVVLYTCLIETEGFCTGAHKCCAGSKWDNTLKKCIDCNPGYTGVGCGKKCTYPGYSGACQKTCNCSKSECDAVSGCPIIIYETSQAAEELTTKSIYIEEDSRKNYNQSNIKPPINVSREYTNKTELLLFDEKGVAPVTKKNGILQNPLMITICCLCVLFLLLLIAYVTLMIHENTSHIRDAEAQ